MKDLEGKGVKIIKEAREAEFGYFGIVEDFDGRKIELYQELNMEQELNTELKDYILKYFRFLMNETEKAAFHNLRIYNRIEWTISEPLKEKLRSWIKENEEAKEIGKFRVG